MKCPSSPNHRLFQITSRYYCAGLVFDVETRLCVEAAPIVKWLVGADFEYVKAYCKRTGFKFRKVESNGTSD